MLLFTINFWMYVYKYEFKENKGICNVSYNIYILYIAVLITNKHYLSYFRYSISTQSLFLFE